MATDIKTDRQAKTISEIGWHNIGVPCTYERVQARVDRHGETRLTRSYVWKKKGFAEINIDPVKSVSLKAAREIGRGYNDAAAKGVDPASAKRAAAMTFGKAADACIDALADGWDSPRTAESWRYHLTHHAASLRDKPVASVSTDDILAVLKPHWNRQHDTADKLRSRVERVLSFAKAKKWRAADSANPAVWRGHLENLLPKQEAETIHHPAVPYDDMPAFMAELAAKPGQGFRALELLALTATRYSQVTLAAWAEFDLDARLWVVPKERCKKRRGQPRKPHVVPLSNAALALLARLRAEAPQDEPLLFPGMGKERPRKDMVALTDGKFVAHGFRSALRDWAADRTNFPDWLLEECLDHLVGSTVRRAYRRGAKDYSRRAEVFEAWAAFLSRQPAAKVVAIR